MNWAALAAITSALGVLASFAVAAYVYGALTQQVKDGKEKAGEHSVTLKEHADKLEDHSEKIGRLQEWKNGFNAAARVSGTKEVS
jgi:hypothetical protein